MTGSNIEDRLTEVESRLEGIERLLADYMKRTGEHSITAPDAARLVAEEHYGE